MEVETGFAWIEVKGRGWTIGRDSGGNSGLWYVCGQERPVSALRVGPPVKTHKWGVEGGE